MEKKKLFNLVGSICLVLILGLLSFVAACARPAPPPAPAPAPTPAPAPAPAPTPAPPSKPIELKLVTFLPAFVKDVAFFLPTVDLINERAKGELIITNVGGPEVIPYRDQAPAVGKGDIDMSLLPSAGYDGLVPGPGMIGATTLSAEEQRQSGAYDILVAMHEKANIRYLGKPQSSTEHNFYVLFTNKQVATPYDLAGQGMSGKTFWDPILKALSMVSVPIEDIDLYTAVERGILDGFPNPPHVATALGLHETVDYFIDHPFFVDDTVVLMNLDKWNSLPKHLQNLVLDTLRERQVEVTPDFATMYQEKGYQVLLDSGLKPITFSKVDAKWYLDTITTAFLRYYMEINPVDSPKLAEALGLGDYLAKLAK